MESAGAGAEKTLIQAVESEVAAAKANKAKDLHLFVQVRSGLRVSSRLTARWGTESLRSRRYWLVQLPVLAAEGGVGLVAADEHLRPFPQNMPVQ